MSVLAQAIAAKHWELAALCLLIGLEASLSLVPPDSAEGILDLLEGSDGQKGC